MFSIRKIARIGPLMLLSLMLLTATTGTAFGEDLTGKTVTWKLTNGRIVDPGQTSRTKEGDFTQGYIVEANAKSSNAPIKKGLFRATLSSFSPAKDMIGQKKGAWYVNGNWEIVDDKASKKKMGKKHKIHSDALIAGRLQTILDFDPTQTPGSFVAETELPMSHLGSKWGKGKGFYHGNQNFEGDFDLTIERWQKVK